MDASASVRLFLENTGCTVPCAKTGMRNKTEEEQREREAEEFVEHNDFFYLLPFLKVREI